MKQDSDSLPSRLLALLSAPDCRPLAERDLAKALRLGFGGRGPLRRALRALEAEGKVRAAGGGKWAPAPADARGNELRGTLRVKHSGDKLFAPFD
ncbi:MAG: hypothetical protein IJS32_03425, partial [Kiritimatiellae bacterium]|nr:hypothetical protein [Kiritimatiellia bacterium]